MKKPMRRLRTWMTCLAIPALAALAVTTVATSAPDTGTNPTNQPARPPVVTPWAPMPTPTIDYFATCVANGTCAAAPAGAVCPGGVPGQPCEMCQLQRTRQQCVFAFSQTCAFSDLGGTATGCGNRWVGVCIGGAGGPCITPTAAGVCSRIICTSGGIL